MAYAYPLPDTLLFNGTDLKSLAGIVVQNLDGLLAPGKLRGDSNDLTIPGADGMIGVAGLPFAAYSFDVPFAVVPDVADGTSPASVAARRAQMIANIRGLAAILIPGLGTLTRRLASSAGPGYDQHTAAGRFLGFSWTFLNPLNGAGCLAQFINLDGRWTDSFGAVVVP